MRGKPVRRKVGCIRYVRRDIGKYGDVGDIGKHLYGFFTDQKKTLKTVTNSCLKKKWDILYDPKHSICRGWTKNILNGPFSLIDNRPFQLKWQHIIEINKKYFGRDIFVIDWENWFIYVYSRNVYSLWKYVCFLFFLMKTI